MTPLELIEQLDEMVRSDDGRYFPVADLRAWVALAEEHDLGDEVPLFYQLRDAVPKQGSRGRFGRSAASGYVADMRPMAVAGSPLKVYNTDADAEVEADERDEQVSDGVEFVETVERVAAEIAAALGEDVNDDHRETATGLVRRQRLRAAYEAAVDNGVFTGPIDDFEKRMSAPIERPPKVRPGAKAQEASTEGEPEMVTIKPGCPRGDLMDMFADGAKERLLEAMADLEDQPDALSSIFGPLAKNVTVIVNV